MRKTHFILLILLVALLACDKKDAGSQDSATLQHPKIRMGMWRGSLAVPGGELPFFFELTGSVEAPAAHLINGAERVPVRNVTLGENTLALNLPAFNSTIEATAEGGVLSGNLRLIKRGAVEQDIPFRALFAEGYTHTIDTDVEVDLSGRWDVAFTEDDGKSYVAVGEFKQDGAKLTGTFLTPTGDYRYLTGEVTGREFYLSCFDGAHAFLFKGEVGTNDRITGDFWSGTKWHESWVGVPDEDAALPDPTTLTFIKDGHSGLAFTFPDVRGKDVAFPSQHYAGKVVVVTVAASWCPNCHDEAAFLAGLYSDYHDQGLEAIGLMYEHYRDFDRAARQVTRFGEKHAIDYPLLVAGYSDKKEAAATLPMLNHVMSYPTIIVIDRKGAVRRIHTGFSGPGTGEHYAAFEQEFNKLIEGLIGEGN